MIRKQTQRDKVLSWLRTRGDLTVREAVLELGINSLPKRIEELRKEGFAISLEWVKTENGSRYGVYKLKEETA